MLRPALFQVLSALAVSASSPAPVRAAPPGEAGTRLEPGPDTVGLVIWGGGRRPGDGEAAMASWNGSDLRSSEEAVALESTGVKGLKAGFHLVVLGACPQEKAQAVFDVVHREHPDAYLRWVAREGPIAQLACPQVTLPPDPCEPPAASPGAPARSADADAGAAARAEAERRSDGERPDEAGRDAPWRRERRYSSGKCTLTVRLSEHYERMDEAIVEAGWTAEAELRKGAEVLDTRKLESPAFAEVDAFTVGDDGVELRTLDLTEYCGHAAGFHDGAAFRRVLGIGRGRITFAEEKTEEDFGVCWPSHGPEADSQPPTCEGQCENAEVAALAELCKGPSDRDRCRKALPALERKEQACEARCARKRR